MKNKGVFNLLKVSSPAFSSLHRSLCPYFCTPLDTIFGNSYPCLLTSHPVRIVASPSLRALYLRFASLRFSLRTLKIVGSTANMNGPLPLQLAQSLNYVDSFDQKHLKVEIFYFQCRIALYFQLQLGSRLPFRYHHMKYSSLVLAIREIFLSAYTQITLKYPFPISTQHTKYPQRRNL